MADLATLNRECQPCTEANGVCNGEVVEITSASARELFIRCAPICLSDSSQEQAAKFYGCLPWLLNSRGAEMSNVVLERVFFRDLQHDVGLLAEARRKAYRQAGVSGDSLPATSYIEQPPCRPLQAFEMQVYAIVSQGDAGVDAGVKVRSFPASLPGTTVKLVEAGGCRHLYITNINGCDPDGAARAPFRQQCDTMFDRSAKLLQDFGTDFSKVVRTWCYLDHIDRDYDQFNISRNEFFAHQHVQRLPASTGIRSGLHPPGTLCAMDLYTLLDQEQAQIEIMRTPTLNEAHEYGSSFSRGMQVALPDKTILFISGNIGNCQCG
jgi:enamine deaminase RidA (YjgF/YER057c/UK114 family)